MFCWWRVEHADRRAGSRVRGYAMMAALVLTAGVLGVSTLVLSRVKTQREDVRRELRTALVESALHSAERAVVSRERQLALPPADGAGSEVPGPSWALVVGQVGVHVQSTRGGPVVNHDLHARWGTLHRRSSVCTTVVPATDPAPVPAGCVRVGPPPAAPPAPLPAEETTPVGPDGAVQR